jgi:hypothetical protein
MVDERRILQSSQIHSKVTEFEYKHGRPRKLIRKKIVVFTIWSMLVFPVVAFAGVGVYFNVKCFLIDYESEWALLGLAAFGIFVFLVKISLNEIVDLYHDGGRIVPYFKRPNSGILAGDAFLAGRTLIQHCESLDLLADSLNVPPLSQFGFQDDFDREEIVWHRAADCMRTVDALIAALNSAQSGLCGQRSDALVLDLRKLRAALNRADGSGVEVSLLIRFNRDFVSAREAEYRLGSLT